MLQDDRIVVIGLGYVGLPLAVAFADKRQVLGFDISSEKISELAAGFDRTGEVGNARLNNTKHLRFSDDIEDLSGESVFICTVPTPITEANHPDFSPLMHACELIGPYLKPGAVVIFESTVYPGCTEEICVPILERLSNLKCDFVGGEQNTFSVGYSPERINPGDKEHSLKNIIKVVSASNSYSLERVKELYESIIDAGTFSASSIKVAEAAKVIENAQRDLNIAFINELAQIFDKMNISILEVLEAARTKWNFLDFRPGLVGGHCIGVDPYYLAFGAEKSGFQANLVLAGRKTNNQMAVFIGTKIMRALALRGVSPGHARVGVLGVTFKENCPDIRNSKVFDLMYEIKGWGSSCLACDPICDAEEVEKNTGFELVEFNDLVELDAILILVPHFQFFTLSEENLRNMAREGQSLTVFDLKGSLTQALTGQRFIDKIGI